MELDGQFCGDERSAQSQEARENGLASRMATSGGWRREDRERLGMPRAGWMRPSEHTSREARLVASERPRVDGHAISTRQRQVELRRAVPTSSSWPLRVDIRVDIAVQRNTRMAPSN
jgi:hypothetical protein